MSDAAACDPGGGGSGEKARRPHRSGVPRSPGKRQSILAPPQGTYPRIPPFPGVPAPTPFLSPPTPQPNMVYKPISESNGYRLMMALPVGHREDGTYGLLTCGVRPDQEYRLSTYYVNSVTYYNLPSDSASCEPPTPM